MRTPAGDGSLPRVEASQREPIQAALLDWYAQNRWELPWRGTRDPYAILVAEVMLQQTQVERVVPKYLEFLGRFPDFPSLVSAGTGELIRTWAPLGYNLRAVRLQRVARQVVARHGGRLPETAGELLPPGRASEWNQALMDLGATVCLSRRPRCPACPLRPGCRAAPSHQVGSGIVAEQRAAYRASPFRGSSRYYRGRIVERLRGLADGASISLEQLGAAVKPDFTDQDTLWLGQLVAGLEQDGLLRIWAGSRTEETRLSLP